MKTESIIFDVVISHVSKGVTYFEDDETTDVPVRMTWDYGAHTKVSDKPGTRYRVVMYELVDNELE